MKYKTVKDILNDIFTIDEIKFEGYNEFQDEPKRLSDPRSYPNGMSQRDFDIFMNTNPKNLPLASKFKKEKFKILLKDFKKEHPHCDIYKNTNEVEQCAILGLCKYCF